LYQPNVVGPRCIANPKVMVQQSTNCDLNGVLQNHPLKPPIRKSIKRLTKRHNPNNLRHNGTVPYHIRFLWALNQIEKATFHCS
jgi:hypothetical protein